MKNVLRVVICLAVVAGSISNVSAADILPPATEATKAFCIDFNWGPGGVNGFAGPGVWADASPEEHVQWYAGLGANVIQTFAVSCNGYAWYKGGVVPPQPGLKHDFLTEVVRLGHARNMRVMGYFCVGANTRWGQLHPELSYGAPSSPHIPFSTPYLDYLCASIEDALRKTGMDGFMIDWVWNPTRPAGAAAKESKERWLDCEKTMFAELLGRPFPGADELTADELASFRRKAIDRCWTRIRQAAKGVRPDCVIWLSCSNLHEPSVQNSTMFREVDWLMNEAPNPEDIAAIRRMIGPQTKLVQCLVGWGDRHDARRVLERAEFRQLGIYGFSRPGPNSLPLPIEEYRRHPIARFTGNDRNIATLLRYYHGLPFDFVAGRE